MAPGLQGYFPGIKKKTFPAVLRRLFSLRAGSLLSGVSHYGTAAYDIIGSRLWKKWLKPLVLPYTLVHCIPSFHTSILPSLPQCRIVFIRHTMLSLSVMLSPWRWAGARLVHWTLVVVSIKELSVSRVLQVWFVQTDLLPWCKPDVLPWRTNGRNNSSIRAFFRRLCSAFLSNPLQREITWFCAPRRQII